MIKILHIVHSLNEGGIERLLLEICKLIDIQKFEIQVCCLVEKGNIADEFENIGIKIHTLAAKREFSFFNIFINFIKIFELAVYIRKNKFDITHGHEFFSTVFSRISGLFGGAKLRFITLHNMYFWWGWGIHFVQKILSYITTKIVCNSVSTLKYSLEKDRIKPEKYEVIYNGIDCCKFIKKDVDKNSFIRQYNISKDAVICMSIGNISPRKGYEYLVKAADLLKNSHPELIYIIVGGKHHQETEEYDKVTFLINNYKLQDRILIIGPKRDIEDILNFSDIFIMPSIVEGFGLSLAEAMSAERIVIASDIEPFKEIVDDKVDGFLFEGRNPIELARTIEKVLELSSEELLKFSQAGRRKILEKFSSGVMVRKYQDLYLPDHG